MEGDVGWFRRNHLVPVAEVNSIAELNALVDEWDLGDERCRIGSRAHTVGEHFATEQPLLQRLPDDAFETGRWFTPRVDRYAQITVRMNTYSVPAKFVGRQLRVLLHASELAVYDGWAEVARHERLMTKGAPASISITTSRFCSTSPEPFPERPRWNKRAPPAGSRSSMTRGGPRRAKPTVTPKAHGR